MAQRRAGLSSLDSRRAEQNKPYDRFARELLTSSGSNFREPPVNFYRAVQGPPAGAIAQAVALRSWARGLRTGRRSVWPGMAAFFSRHRVQEDHRVEGGDRL